MEDVSDFGPFLRLESLCEVIDLRNKRVVLVQSKPDVEAAAILTRHFSARVWLGCTSWTRPDYERILHLGCEDVIHLVSGKEWVSLLPDEAFDVVLSEDVDNISLDRACRLLAPGGMVGAIASALVREPLEIGFIRMMHEDGLFGVLGVDLALPKTAKWWQAEWGKSRSTTVVKADVPVQSQLMVSEWIAQMEKKESNAQWPRDRENAWMTKQLLTDGEVTILRLVARRTA